MLEQLCILYAGQKWAKYIIWIGTLALGVLLFGVSGGFPPHAWRFLLQTLPLVPHLWMLKGSGMLFPLFQLVTLSLALLCCWLFLAASVVWIAQQEWHYYREQRDFAASLERAEEQSIQNVSNSDVDRQNAQWWEVQTQQFPKEVIQISPSLPLPISSQPLPTTSRPPTGQGMLRRQSRAEITDPKRLTFAIGSGLDAGIKRKNRPNEDNLLVIQGTHTYNSRAYPFGLFVVADGMGGHSKGQEASRLAIQHIRETVMPVLLSNAEIDGDHARTLLLDALHHANLAVHQSNQQQHIDMGTTVTAAMMIDTTIAVANVGDSRTYLYRAQDGLKQVTKDHSLVGQLLARGEISEEDVYTHPQRNEIYRCIGEKATVQADTFLLPLEAETTLLLCSDGLWEMVRKPHIEQILRDTLPDAAQTSKALIQAALEGGGLDNVSAIVVHIASQANMLRLLPQEQSPITPQVALYGRGRTS